MLVQARHRGYSFARTTAAVGWKAESTLDTPEGVMAQEVRYLRIALGISKSFGLK